MKTKMNMIQLHEEHKSWSNKLAFYKDELKIMQNRISEVAVKNTAKEIQAFIEHFQNQLVIQKEQIDILNHSIGKHESFLVLRANENPTAVDHEAFPDHEVQRTRVETFETLFGELRKELISFISKWM